MQPVNKMTNWLSGPRKYYFFVMHKKKYAAVVEICQDIVDKSSSWNSSPLVRQGPCNWLALSPEVFQVSLDCIFPSYSRSSTLPFPWYVRPKHFPRCVFFISPRHMPLPVRHSLGDLLRSLHHSRCPS